MSVSLEPSYLQLKLSKSEIQNIQEYAESGKTLLIKINDAIHDNACTGYYFIANTKGTLEDPIIRLRSFNFPYSMVVLATASTPLESGGGGTPT